MSSRMSGDAWRLRQEEEPQSRGQIITTGTWMEEVLPGMPPDGDLHYDTVEIVLNDNEYIYGQVSRSDNYEEDIDEDMPPRRTPWLREEDNDDEVYDLINTERSSSSLGSLLPRLARYHNIIVCCNNDVFWERRRREQVTDEEDNYENPPPSRRQRSEEEELNDLERSFSGTQLHSTSSSTLDSELFSDSEDFDDVEQDDDDDEELDRRDSERRSSSSRSTFPNFERMSFSNLSRYGLAFGWIRGHYMRSEE
ncbi:uncharacterized protein Hap1MRO34_010492 isoform 2-T2 [Clarias gariepinus]|nr:guanine nucleotide-binding protein-like 3 homolog isoform X2 [Clarias gariepinus]